MLAYLEAAGAPDDPWLQEAVIEYCPFVLPPEIEFVKRDERRSLVVEQLSRFHEAVLLGRRT